jgi:hypothetical protein
MVRRMGSAPCSFSSLWRGCVCGMWLHFRTKLTAGRNCFGKSVCFVERFLFRSWEFGVYGELLILWVSIDRHILRKKVEVRDISEELAVWQYFGGKLAQQPDNATEAEAGSIGWGATTDESALSSAQTNGAQWRWYKDPRLGTLGLRGLFAANTRKDLPLGCICTHCHCQK